MSTTSAAFDVDLADIKRQALPAVEELLRFSACLPGILRLHDYLDAEVMALSGDPEAGEAYESVRDRSGVTAVRHMLMHIAGSIEEMFDGTGFCTIDNAGDRAALIAGLNLPAPVRAELTEDSRAFPLRAADDSDEDPALGPVRKAFDLLREAEAQLLLASVRLEVPPDDAS
ncbi:MAG TPA: hypothetical protein VNF71_07005 [Acidimicrobiales bacterium]|nr:hypothetical protein [Acidimicrobiales bacterium]